MNIILSGFNGAMGKNVLELISEDESLMITSGIDRKPNKYYTFKQFTDYSDENIKGDIIVDFSHFSLVPNMLEFCKRTHTPVVLCTTGLTDEILKQIEETSKYVPIFKSGNMSLGINLLIDIVKKASTILEDFDIEIIEKHHNKKVDSPSGTAKMIANSIKSVLNEKEFIYGREGNDTKRKKNEIAIHAVRGGTIVGEHEIIFAGTDEIITLSHSARSKKVFAKGAIEAAKFIYGKESGLYRMDDMLK
ncbi:4-hydroxy-tetrahydrodipicolinate reductase [Helicovermis profundi]|uniref:4-hydroxy-tetrahydrodipicolinate reductase n=2 Tax=Helicovermis profundi TaxID=3065157 RepID=A0AAU9EDA3_9FIRM|nr:4-hydroxy-tetrahydrodipicolinate reductase [Clostridia bacterium S502]